MYKYLHIHIDCSHICFGQKLRNEDFQQIIIVLFDLLILPIKSNSYLIALPCIKINMNESPNKPLMVQ